MIVKKTNGVYMDEVKRFMRYVIPGINMIIILLLFLIITKDISAEDIKIGLFQNVLIMFFASGILGYILSNIYFPVIWTKPFSFMLCNHLTWIKSSRNKINIVDAEMLPINIDKLKKQDAWIITNILWNRFNDKQKVISYEKMSQRLVDIMHSIGTSIVGLILGYILWTFLHYSIFNHLTFFCLKDIIYHITWFIILFAYFFNFFSVKSKLTSTSNSILIEIIDDLYMDYRNNKKPIKFFYMKD